MKFIRTDFSIFFLAEESIYKEISTAASRAESRKVYSKVKKPGPYSPQPSPWLAYGNGGVQK